MCVRSRENDYVKSCEAVMLNKADKEAQQQRLHEGEKVEILLTMFPKRKILRGAPRANHVASWIDNCIDAHLRSAGVKIATKASTHAMVSTSGSSTHTHLFNFSVVEVVVVVFLAVSRVSLSLSPCCVWCGVVWCVARWPDNGNCHERDGRCRHHTNLYARIRTFFSCAPHT